MTADPAKWVVECSAATLLKNLERWPDADVRAALWLRFRSDIPLFAAYCFPSLVTLAYSSAQLEILRQFAAIPGATERAGLTLRSAEAPRGMAKTTLLKIVIAHRIVYALEPYTMWLGPTQPEAQKELRHLVEMFREPESALAEIYGPFEVAGSINSQFVIVCGGGPPVAVACRSAPGGTVRGSNYNGQRPTFIAGDDIERPKTVQNATLRAELSEWIQSDVMNAGPKQGGLLVWQQGTRLHPDSQTARNARDPAFQALRFQSMIAWPERMDLWEQCRALWADLSNPDREGAAQDFYREHRAEMDRGAEVLDPINVPLFALMQTLWRIGRRAFAKDQQNEPQMGDEALFDLDSAVRCGWDGESVTNGRTGKRWPIRQCQVGVFLDPRNSEAIERNDFAGISVVARDPDGYRYLLVCDLKRDNLSGGRSRMWRYFERFGTSARYGYEDNGAQVLHGESFDREREERRAEGKAHSLIARGYRSSDNKIDRIARLQPDVENGWFQLADTLGGTALEQWRDLPNGTHDDGPDSAERADWLISQSMPTLAAPW